MPLFFSYLLNKFWNVIVASVLLSRRTFTCSFASMAWCSPSEYRRPGMMRPVNSSTIMTSPSGVTT